MEKADNSGKVDADPMAPTTTKSTQWLRRCCAGADGGSLLYWKIRRTPENSESLTTFGGWNIISAGQTRSWG